MLDLLYLLVKYGYYDDLDDINSLIPSLVSLLNGKNDTPFPNANDEQSITYRQVREQPTVKLFNYLIYRKNGLKIIM